MTHKFTTWMDVQISRHTPLLKFKQIVMIIRITMIIIVFQMIKKVKEEIENFIIKIENHNIDDKLFNQSSSPIIELNTEIGPQPQSVW